MSDHEIEIEKLREELRIQKEKCQALEEECDLLAMVTVESVNLIGINFYRHACNLGKQRSSGQIRSIRCSTGEQGISNGRKIS